MNQSEFAGLLDSTRRRCAPSVHPRNRFFAARDDGIQCSVVVPQGLVFTIIANSIRTYIHASFWLLYILHILRGKSTCFKSTSNFNMPGILLHEMKLSKKLTTPTSRQWATSYLFRRNKSFIKVQSDDRDCITLGNEQMEMFSFFL